MGFERCSSRSLCLLEGWLSSGWESWAKVGDKLGWLCGAGAVRRRKSCVLPRRIVWDSGDEDGEETAKCAERGGGIWDGSGQTQEIEAGKWRREG